MAIPDSTENTSDAQEPLREDNDTPFSTPDDSQGSLAADHRASDSNIDEYEAYDEGLSGAAQAEDR